MALYANAPSAQSEARPVRPLPVRSIGRDDVFDSLRDGWDDYIQHPSHYGMLAVLYPIIGVALGVWTSRNGSIASLYPLVSGFALVAPIAALGFYEISRRRARGEEPSWYEVLEFRHSRRLRPVALLGLVLGALFLVWMLTAYWLFQWLAPAGSDASIATLVQMVFTTPNGWALVLIGNAVGAVFAFAAFCLSVVSVPLYLDRDVGFLRGILTSIDAVRRNPGPMALWAALLALILFAASLPLFVGLLVALPVLGHGTFWLYRRVVV